MLLISERMDRTGAPAQLVTLLPGLREALDAHLTLLIGSEGALTATASQHVDRLVRLPSALRILHRLERRAPGRAAHLLHRVWGAAVRRWSGPADLVYVNSLISTRLAGPFAGRPMMVHVHELGSLADSFGDEARGLVRRADDVLVPSLAVKDWVVACGAAPSHVLVLPGSVPVSAFDGPTPEAVAKLRVRATAPAGTTTVASVGWIGALKGSDRFLEVATLMADRHERRVRFVWVGGGSASEERRFLEDIARRGLEDVVRVLPGMDDLRSLYAMADLILIASREESLSLVALESAALGTPVVCFPGAGGPDLLAVEGVVTTSTTEEAPSVVDAIEALLAAPDVRSARTAAAREAVRSLHGVARVQATLVAAMDARVQAAAPLSGDDRRG